MVEDNEKGKKEALETAKRFDGVLDAKGLKIPSSDCNPATLVVAYDSSFGFVICGSGYAKENNYYTSFELIEPSEAEFIAVNGNGENVSPKAVYNVASETMHIAYNKREDDKAIIPEIIYSSSFKGVTDFYNITGAERVIKKEDVAEKNI